MIPAIATWIQKQEGQNSIVLKWGKPAKELKIYFNDIEHLTEQLKELHDWGYIPEFAFNEKLNTKKGKGGDENGRE